MKHTIETRIKTITHTIARHNPQARLLAVSKTKPIEMITTAYHAGVRDFGENYVQEAAEKVAAVNKLGLEIIWHYIGRIQNKKCRDIATYFQWVHTLEREDTAEKLQLHLAKHNKKLNVCMQVNISEDDNKGGIAPDLACWCQLANRITALPALRLRGIMVMPHTEDTDAFARAHALFAEFQSTQAGQGCDTLSMGMTHDYQTALTQGATIVRIGSGIFGERNEQAEQI